jgi:hypothetical protein
VSSVGVRLVSAAVLSWDVLLSCELVELASQRAAALLSQGASTGLMRTGAPEMRRCDQRVAGLAGGDGDLHERFSWGLMQTARGSDATRAVDECSQRNAQRGGLPGGASTAPKNETRMAVRSTRRQTGIGFSAKVLDMGLRNGWDIGVSLWQRLEGHNLRK